MGHAKFGFADEGRGPISPRTRGRAGGRAHPKTSYSPTYSFVLFFPAAPTDRASEEVARRLLSILSALFNHSISVSAKGTREPASAPYGGRRRARRVLASSGFCERVECSQLFNSAFPSSVYARKKTGGLGMALELGRQSCRSVNLSHDNLNYANVTPSAIKERPPPTIVIERLHAR